MEVLQRCKMHGGPLTIEDIERIDTLNDEQVNAEASYLKKTISPNIRFKRKVGNKFINFTTEELRQQIKDAIKPKFDQAPNLDMLLEQVLSDEDNLTSSSEEAVAVGTVGWFISAFEEEKVGVVVEESSLQLYKFCRYGFKPSGLLVDLKDWIHKESIDNYEYIAKGDAIFLVI